MWYWSTQAKRRYGRILLYNGHCEHKLHIPTLMYEYTTPTSKRDTMLIDRGKDGETNYHVHATSLGGLHTLLLQLMTGHFPYFA